MKIEGSQVLEAAKTVPNIPRDVRQVRRRSLQSASHTNNAKKDDGQKQRFGRREDDSKEEKERWRLDRARFINCSRSPKLNDCSFLGPSGFLIYKRRTAQPHPTFSLTIMKQLMGLGLKVGEKTLILQRNKVAASRKTPTCAAQPFFSLTTHVAIANKEASPPLVSLLWLSKTASSKPATFFSLNKTDALKIVGILFVEGTNGKLEEFSYFFSIDTSRSSVFNAALCNDWLLGSRDVSQVTSPFISWGSQGELFCVAEAFEGTYQGNHNPIRISHGASFVLSKPVKALFWFCMPRGHKEAETAVAMKTNIKEAKIVWFSGHGLIFRSGLKHGHVGEVEDSAKEFMKGSIIEAKTGDEVLVFYSAKQLTAAYIRQNRKLQIFSRAEKENEKNRDLSKVLIKCGKILEAVELEKNIRVPANLVPCLQKFHPVFHISALKKSVQYGTVIPTIPPALSKQLELQIQSETVCKVRKLMNGQLEVLIQWKNMPSHENPWEGAETIATQFPGFHLEDKVKLLGEGNERTLSNGKIYARRPRKTPIAQTREQDAF